MSARLALVLLYLVTASRTHAEEAKAPPIVEAIRSEALRTNLDPDGRPLPLAAHWHRMTCPLDFQLDLIRGGHHLLPWLPTPTPDQAADGALRGNEDGLKQLAAWHLPFALVTGGQWEASLYDQNQRWRGLPPEESPLVWSVEPAPGKPTAKMLSPFGTVAPWGEVGKYWIGSPGMQRIQEVYPDPPLALIISNNEASRLRWYNAETDRRYVDRFGKERDDAFKRKAFADGWTERYGAMLAAMRASLANDAWRKNARFVAYNAFGLCHFGRPDFAGEGGWTKYSLTTDDRIDPGPYIWDGAIPEYYDNGWQREKSIFSVYSCQVEMMNEVFMKAQVLRDRPDFWYELIFWDGNLPGAKEGQSDRYETYAALGYPSSPARYQGWVQFGMWLLVPRVAREWRSSADKRERWWEYFSRIIDSVDRVYADPVLTRFWRKGELVPNRAHPHPFDSGIPDRWKDADRWFGLDTTLDPPRPWKLTTQLPVFALARVIGEAPRREWLLYAHSPMGDRAKVGITIPGYRQVTVDVALAGSFYLVREADGSIAAVGRQP